MGVICGGYMFRFILVLLLLINGGSIFGAEDGENSWLRYEDVPKVRGMDIDINGVRHDDYAFYAALQYGSKSVDVLYMIFECEEKLAPHDVVYLYVPGDAKYGKIVRLNGRKRADGHSFTGIKLFSKYDNVSAQMNISIKVRSLWDSSKLDVDMEAYCILKDTREMRKSSFALKGNLDAVMNDACYIEAVHMFQSPELKGRWDHRSDPPHIRGKISMGDWGLFPESGMSNQAVLNVYEKDAVTAKMTRTFRVEPAGAYSEFTFYPWKRLRERREYGMKLMMDLSPFFGQLTVFDSMVLR